MKKYKKAFGTKLCKHEGNFHIIIGNEIFNLNEVGARIFDLCNGKNGTNDISKKIAKKYERSKKAPDISVCHLYITINV